MKGILLDENLPGSINLPTKLPTVAATELSESATDTAIWEHAKKHELVILTKDADFSHRVLFVSPPPWIVHIRLGNYRLRHFIDHIVAIWPSVESMLPHYKLISVFPDRIEAIE